VGFYYIYLREDFAMSTSTVLSVRGVKADMGTKVYGNITFGEMADGTPYRVPIVLVNGSKPGPTLLVTAGLHGDEVVGAETVRIVASKIDPKTFAGRFIGLPVINVPAFLITARVNLLENPVGYNDLSRLIPTAQADGSLTERIAAFVRDDVYPLADTVVDIHSSAIGSTNYARAIVCGDYLPISKELLARSNRLAKACGFEYIFKPRAASWKGMYFAPRSYLQEELGKAAIVLETGHVPTFEGADIIVQGTWNIMIDLGMVQGEAHRAPKQVYMDKLYAVRANRGGLWHAKAGLGVEVKEGELLGTINGPMNEVLEEIVSPVAGISVKVATAAMCPTGTRVFVIGTPYQD
jgi:predicted deacylase